MQSYVNATTIIPSIKCSSFMLHVYLYWTIYSVISVRLHHDYASIILTKVVVPLHVDCNAILIRGQSAIFLFPFCVEHIVF